ncbi:hypothetical protein C8J57DRAFT_1626476 [Mycena rebaudengoi]|nr:hypothetical protein C8J57DRAFT_1626476 [Mycena rebaudengoi]
MSMPVSDWLGCSYVQGRLGQICLAPGSCLPPGRTQIKTQVKSPLQPFPSNPPRGAAHKCGTKGMSLDKLKSSLDNYIPPIFLPCSSSASILDGCQIHFQRCIWFAAFCGSDISASAALRPLPFDPPCRLCREFQATLFCCDHDFFNRVFAGLINILPGLRTGPLLLGDLFSYAFLGILVFQLALYLQHHPNDPLWLKILAQCGASGWGDLDALNGLKVTWSFAVLPLLTALVASIIQFFFAWRIWRLEGSIIIPISIYMVSLLQGVMAPYCTIQAWLGHATRYLLTYATTWLGASAFADVLTTAAMVIILFRKRAVSVFKETRSVLHVGTLILSLLRPHLPSSSLTNETGMFTTVAAILQLAIAARFPYNLYSVFFLMLPKIYSNTLLAILNSRLALDGPLLCQPPLWIDEIIPDAFRSTGLQFAGESIDLGRSEGRIGRWTSADPARQTLPSLDRQICADLG